MGYNVDLSAGFCFIFPDPAIGELFEMWINGVFLEVAAQRGEIPFRSLVTFLLNLIGIVYGRAGGI